MAKTVAKKLRIKPDDRVLVAAATAQQCALLNPLPENAALVVGTRRSDEHIVVAFAADRAGLDARLAELLPNLAGGRAAWVVYPKGNVTDINRDSIWRRVQELGWTLNANVSVDATWSAVRLRIIDGAAPRR